MPVPGLLGGADAAPALPFETLLVIEGGAAKSLGERGIFPFPFIDSPFTLALEEEKLLGGGPAADAGRGADVGAGGPTGLGTPETARRGPGVAFGGGGVATGVGVSSAPAFLLTQRFNSGS
jgi:hypothetical protein